MNAKHNHDAAIVLSARGHESIDDLNMPFEEIKFESTSFTDHEYDLLFDLFTDFNKSFNIIIDTYEEDAGLLALSVQSPPHLITT